MYHSPRPLPSSPDAIPTVEEARGLLPPAYMNPFPAFLSYPNGVDVHMKRAKSLKGESQISYVEIKQLIRQLDDAIQQAPDKWKRDRLQGTYSFAEVTRTAGALRHLLMSVEVMKKATEPGTPPILREKARLQLLKAVLAI